MNILYILLALGIVGHAINMYCDRILSIFPNGTLKLVNYSKLKEGDYAAKLMEGVSPSVPMRSGVLGVFAIVLEFCGYAALAAYAYQKAPVYGAILFAGTTFACIVSSAYHLKCGLVEYMFLKYGRDERAKGMMLDLMGSGASLRLCSLGMRVLLPANSVLCAWAGADKVEYFKTKKTGPRQADRPFGQMTC